MKYLISIIGCGLFLFQSLEAQVSLRLLINYSYTDTVAPGDPVIIELQLYNADAEFAVVHNQAVRKNLELLQQEYTEGKWTQEDYDSEKSILENALKSENPVSVSGEALRSRMAVLFDSIPLANINTFLCNGEPSPQEYSITAGERLRMQFGIPPERTKAWRMGSHTIQVMLDTLHTNAHTLVVVPTGQDTEPANEKRINLGYFYLDCGDPVQSLEIAEELLKTAPDHLDAITLKADYYMTTGDTIRALEWYENALKLFYRQYPASYEAPEYLLSQIAALKPQE